MALNSRGRNATCRSSSASNTVPGPSGTVSTLLSVRLQPKMDRRNWLETNERAKSETGNLSGAQMQLRKINCGPWSEVDLIRVKMSGKQRLLGVELASAEPMGGQPCASPIFFSFIGTSIQCQLAQIEMWWVFCWVYWRNMENMGTRNFGTNLGLVKTSITFQGKIWVPFRVGFRQWSSML